MSQFAGRYTGHRTPNIGDPKNVTFDIADISGTTDVWVTWDGGSRVRGRTDHSFIVFTIDLGGGMDRHFYGAHRPDDDDPRKHHLEGKYADRPRNGLLAQKRARLAGSDDGGWDGTAAEA
jgi:hypothetical protein